MILFKGADTKQIKNSKNANGKEIKKNMHLYYYRRRVRKNLSAKFDNFLAERSQFDSGHRVDFSTPTSSQTATFVRPLFAFVLCFFTTKKHKQRHRCDESVSIWVIDQLRGANDDPNALR